MLLELPYYWFYGILELDLENTHDLDLTNTWTNLLESNWFYYNQAGGADGKVWKLELSVKQLVNHFV